jgi:hypothetical protein
MGTGLIRPQYHFRSAHDGLMAWDVRRLIHLSEGLPIILWPVARIAEVDEDWWYAHGAKPTVRSIAEHMQLAQAADLSFPILLCQDGRLMDGMHRVLKAISAGVETLPARQFVATPPPDHRNADPDSLSYEL